MFVESCRESARSLFGPAKSGQRNQLDRAVRQSAGVLLPWSMQPSQERVDRTWSYQTPSDPTCGLNVLSPEGGEPGPGAVRVAKPGKEQRQHAERLSDGHGDAKAPRAGKQEPGRFRHPYPARRVLRTAGPREDSASRAARRGVRGQPLYGRGESGHPPARRSACGPVPRETMRAPTIG